MPWKRNNVTEYVATDGRWRIVVLENARIRFDDHCNRFTADECADIAEAVAAAAAELHAIEELQTELAN